MNVYLFLSCFDIENVLFVWVSLNLPPLPADTLYQKFQISFSLYRGWNIENGNSSLIRAGENKSITVLEMFLQYTHQEKKMFLRRHHKCFREFVTNI